MLLAEITAISIAAIVVLTAILDGMARLGTTGRHTLLRSKGNADVR
ncbi:MAG: hypothetical protein AAGD10_16295 [Myxococcota bacterium]